MDDLERSADSRSEEQEMLWQRMLTLEEQQVELQVIQEDLENCSRCHNLKNRGVPRGAEVDDIPAFTRELLHTIHSSPEAPSLVLDRTHQVSFPTGSSNIVPDILTRVHFYTDKEDILRASRRKADLVFN